LDGVESLRDLQRNAAQELWGYLETNRDSPPNYGNVTGLNLPISGGLYRIGRQRNRGQTQEQKSADAREPLPRPAVLDGTGSFPQAAP
jgi:hypothetical protein